MGKPAAKKTDQIVSATPGDVHIIMVPSPGGPVPTPIPHPCTSIIKDKVAEKVKVMGLPGAVKGSISQHTPPHIPMGPGPFQKPPKNKGEIVTASSNVFYEGKEAAMLGDTAKMCADPSDAPVGKVIGTAATVLVGGGGQGSDADRAAAAAQAMAAAAAHCHAWINANMPAGADREQAHRDVCTATGHPIDVATGKMFTRVVELRLRGRIPFELVRNYSSARPDRGPLGRGWRHSFEITLFVHADFVAHRDANGRYLAFEPVGPGGTSRNELARATLHGTSTGYVLETADGRRQVFDDTVPRLRIDGGAIAWPIAALTDTFGNAVRFDYRPDGMLSGVVDTAGRVVSIEYDARLLVTALRLSQGRPGDTAELVRRYEYDGDLLVRSSDITGAAVQYAYAGEGLLVQETDAAGFSFYFTYDADGWCRETWGDGGLLYRLLEYDRARHRTRVTDSLGRTATYEWTDAGVVVRETDPEGHAWDFRYNDALQQVLARDPLGHVWSYEYDAAGRLVATSDPEGNSSAYTYDALGRITGYTDRAGQDWAWGYAPGDTAARMRGPMKHGSGIVRDERGDVTHVANRFDELHRLEYSERGDLVRILHASGLDVRRAHTASGNLERESDQYGARVRFTYDERGRIRSRWQRDKGRETYERDAAGRITAMTDDQGRRHEYEWCNFNRLRRVRLPEITLADGTAFQPIKEFEYDTENRLTAVRLPGGETVHYDYETHLARPTRVRYPDGRVQEFHRNARGFVTSLVENGELVFQQEVDSAGRVRRRTTGDDEESTFEYDPMGRLAVAEADACSLAIARDDLGRVTGEAWDHGAIAFAYDDTTAFRRVTVTHTDAEEDDENAEFVTELIATAGRSITVQAAGRVAGGLVLDALNRLQSVSCGSARGGTRIETTYGNSQLPGTRCVVGPDDVPVRVDRYGYDASGRLQSAFATVEARDTTPRSLSTRYHRDPLGRLSEESVELPSTTTTDQTSVRRTTWSYDGCANRVLQQEAADGDARPHAIDERSYQPGNRLARSSSVDLTYDARGRVIARRDADGRVTQFSWDAVNRLREVKTNDGETFRMTYDPLGRRVALESSEGVTRFFYNDKKLVHETRPDGRQRHYLYASGSFQPILCFERAAGQDDWSASAYVTDPRGCPEAMIAADGRVTWEASVDPWGGRRSSGSADVEAQPLALPGQYVDRTGLAYNHARYYMPDLGAYLSPDPIGLNGGDRFYAYADDPICWIDPLGLSEDDYTPPPEVAACGPLQAPWMTRPGELEIEADIRAVKPGFPMVLDPNETDRYLYVVTEDGTVLYAPQSPQGVPSEYEIVKHTTLAGEDAENPGQANPMRVAGEINYDPDTGQWVMDGASGRYSYDANTDRETRTPENVAAAAALANAEPGGTPVVPAPYVFPP